MSLEQGRQFLTNSFSQELSPKLPEQNQEFCKSKELLISSIQLVYYNSTKEIVFACNTLPYGIGAVKSHIIENNEEKSIAYAPCTLTVAERNICTNYQFVCRRKSCGSKWGKEVSSDVVWLIFHNIDNYKLLLGLLTEREQERIISLVPIGSIFYLFRDKIKAIIVNPCQHDNCYDLSILNVIVRIVGSYFLLMQ